MFAVVCPYCTFRNERGARFCADCGAPLHLKPCQKCSKVDDVMVRQCLGCGTAFLPIELYDPETGESIGAPPPPEAEPEAPVKPAAKLVRHTYGAGPLIAVALVAGALPTLWMNRHLFPQPKAWQTTPVKPLAPVEAPRPPATSPTPPAAVQPEPVPTAAPVETPPAVASTPTEAAPKPKEKKSTKSSEKKRAKEATETSAEASADPARPCTESLVALGLCDKSQIQK